MSTTARCRAAWRSPSVTGQALEQRERRARVGDLPAAPLEHAGDGVRRLGARRGLGDAALELVGAGGMVVAEAEQAGGDLGAGVAAGLVPGAAERGEGAARRRARGRRRARWPRRAGRWSARCGRRGRGPGPCPGAGRRRRASAGSPSRAAGRAGRSPRWRRAAGRGRRPSRCPWRPRTGGVAARRASAAGAAASAEQGSGCEGESSHRLDIDWRVRPLEPRRASSHYQPEVECGLRPAQSLLQL